MSARMRSNGQATGAPTTTPIIELSKMPLYSEGHELDEITDLDENTQKWLETIGGHTPKDHVRRVIDGLLSHDLQTRVNRKGTFNKTKFPDVLEKALISSTIQHFPKETTVASVEKMIGRCFKNAPDRCGGRSQRENKKKTMIPSKRASKRKHAPTTAYASNDSSDDSTAFINESQ